MLTKSCLAAAMAALIAGCSISPRPKVVADDNFCNLPLNPLSIEAGDGRPMVPTETFTDLLQNLYAAPTQNLLPGPPLSNSILALSGGSQHGAFGAGVLSKWAEGRADGRLPRFRIVSGVSTGSIMATHAFLGETAPILKNYAIRKEGQILHPYVKTRKLGLGSGLTVVRKGAMGDLGPMRGLLKDAITPDVLDRVAAEAGARGLFVGIVDVDTGQAMVVNMTKLAQNYHDATAERDKERLRNCYLDVIVASSSVPMAALPTFIDNRMYIDGGARFGVLPEEVSEFLDKADAARRAAAAGATPQAHIYVVINGDLRVSQRCGKADLSICGIANPDDEPTQNIGALDGAHDKWNLLSLAQRSVSILIDQVYRFSNARALTPRKDGAFLPHLLRIDPEAKERFETTIALDGTPPDLKLSCRDWRAMDDRLEHPIEFHPRYMHCLIAYGRSAVERERWAAIE